MVKPTRRTRPSSSTCLSPNYKSQSSESRTEHSSDSAFEGTGSGLSQSKSLQPTCTSHDSMMAKPPSLKEILLDVAAPPWTLSAFMAYLSHNHCMETLEFTLDSQHYTDLYSQLSDDSSPDDIREQVHNWWHRLLQTYIVPCSPREVNIPSRVRERLLNLPDGPLPPHPSELDESGRIIYELMNDSLLVPFLQSMNPLQYSTSKEDGALSPRHQAQFDTARVSGAPTRIDSEGLTDDSDSNSPPPLEPMTPPTTPPTSEYTFNSSPGGLQRAVAAHSKGWKNLGAKLGFSRKGINRRSTPSSSDCDANYTETSHGQQSRNSGTS
ncbi:hypothetical protein CDD80_2092 [Ophiocordyceps camponoti-rufipedis]|uniref:RGS domain-containing protein n=1 Tax=Ophiocordyceps camponoti-rufipedis TaxID=2004952 RepID=A0A2C5ZJ93_9HYPO|nr:hypothetical protein CDD80_2092 [Ophiocordyceps camponoti-rufipedis]